MHLIVGLYFIAGLVAAFTKWAKIFDLSVSAHPLNLFVAGAADVWAWLPVLAWETYEKKRLQKQLRELNLRVYKTKEEWNN